MDKLFTICLKRIIPDKRLMVSYDGNVRCVDCMHEDGTLLLSDDLITKTSGSMIRTTASNVKYHHEHTVENNKIIRELRDNGYDEYADILSQIPHL